MNYISAISKYEMTRIIAERAREIEKNSPPLIQCISSNPIDIATKEFNNNLLNYFIKRKYGKKEIVVNMKELQNYFSKET